VLSTSDKRLCPTSTYCDTAKLEGFDGGAEYANVDTLFSLGETYLFCQLVELKEEAQLKERADCFLGRVGYHLFPRHFAVKTRFNR
jgi:hypothetical protein